MKFVLLSCICALFAIQARAAAVQGELIAALRQGARVMTPVPREVPLILRGNVGPLTILPSEDPHHVSLQVLEPYALPEEWWKWLVLNPTHEKGFLFGSLSGATPVEGFLRHGIVLRADPRWVLRLAPVVGQVEIPVSKGALECNAAGRATVEVGSHHGIAGISATDSSVVTVRDLSGPCALVSAFGEGHITIQDDSELVMGAYVKSEKGTIDHPRA